MHRRRCSVQRSFPEAARKRCANETTTLHAGANIARLRVRSIPCTSYDATFQGGRALAWNLQNVELILTQRDSLTAATDDQEGYSKM